MAATAKASLKLKPGALKLGAVKIKGGPSPAQREWLKQLGALTPITAAVPEEDESPVTAPGASEQEPLVGAGIDFTPLLLQLGGAVLNEVKKLLGGRRIAVMEIHNGTKPGTGVIIRRGSIKPSEGGIFMHPPDDIEPGKSVFVVAASVKTVFGVLKEGSIGTMKWQVVGGQDWIINWKVPRTGSPAASNTVDGSGPNSGRFIPDEPQFTTTAIQEPDSGVREFRFVIRDFSPGPQPQPVPVPPNPQPGPSTQDIRSNCVITVQNDTEHTLKLAGQKHERGDFLTFPAKSVPPGGSTQFVSVESPRAKVQGCKGHVIWNVDTKPVSKWRIEWDNPEEANNTATATIEPNKAGLESLEQIGQDDQNVPVVFTLSGGGGPTPPETKKLRFAAEFKNNTQSPLRLEVFVTSGKFETEPPQTIKPGATGQFAAVHEADGSGAGAQKLEGEIEFTVMTDDAKNRPLWKLNYFNDGKARAGAKIESDAFETPAPQPTDGPDSSCVYVLEEKGGGEPEDNNFNPPAGSRQPTLRLKDKNSDGWVEFLQKLLNQKLNAGLKVDGDFGPATLKAVKKFQTDNGLQVDGTVGNQTWAALRGATAEKPSTDGRKAHTFKEKGAEARFDNEKEDALYDHRTDTLVFFVASVGDEPIDKFNLHVRATPPDAPGKARKFVIGKPKETFPTGGARHEVRIPKFRKLFPSKDPKVPVTDYKLEAFFDDELGKDVFRGKVTFEIEP